MTPLEYLYLTKNGLYFHLPLSKFASLAPHCLPEGRGAVQVSAPRARRASSQGVFFPSGLCWAVHGTTYLEKFEVLLRIAPAVL